MGTMQTFAEWIDGHERPVLMAMIHVQALPGTPRGELSIIEICAHAVSEARMLTELGVDAGLLGLVAFVGWLVELVVALVPRSQWLAASVAALAVLGLQTDVIGIHWLSVVVFALAGAALRAGTDEPPPEEAL